VKELGIIDGQVARLKPGGRKPVRHLPRAIELGSAPHMNIHTLKNRTGMGVRFLPIGGAIVAIEVPDRAGRVDNVVLAFAGPSAYRDQTAYFGTVCGRYANRIGGARFSIDGAEYRLHATDGTSSVHGGRTGFDKAVWSVEPLAISDGVGARLTHTRPDGNEGYPGTLSVTMEYRLGDDDAFTIDYRATTDKATIINLTNHSHFNLAGDGSGDVLSHVFEINADRYTPADAILIPTGEIATVADTPFDFRSPTPIGHRIRTPHEQMIAGKGYDLNYVVNRTEAAAIVLAARVYEPQSGRVLEVHTSEPGIQFYTGNLLDGTLVGAHGLYRQSDGFCLEPHHYPDSPNRPEFPSTVLRPSETYSSTTVYRFSSDAS
jgi:aldose 1-epimerase